jgi:hypothetical protein
MSKSSKQSVTVVRIGDSYAIEGATSSEIEKAAGPRPNVKPALAYFESVSTKRLESNRSVAESSTR